MRYTLLSSLIIFLSSCIYYDHAFSYDFENPEEIIKLEKQLKEISGLHYKDSNTLYGIQDEIGQVFEIDLKSGKATKIVSFKETGDFEGLSKKGESFYVLKSNGDIYDRLNIKFSHT